MVPQPELESWKLQQNDWVIGREGGKARKGTGGIFEMACAEDRARVSKVGVG